MRGGWVERAVGPPTRASSHSHTHTACIYLEQRQAVAEPEKEPDEPQKQDRVRQPRKGLRVHVREVDAEGGGEPADEEGAEEEGLPDEEVVEDGLPPFGLEELDAQRGGGGVGVAPDALCWFLLCGGLYG